MTGVVKFFDDAKGYGFIVNDENKKDVFVHYTGIEGKGHRSLKDGQKVTFDVVIDEKSGKERAVNVK
ncbi:MAG: cold-shock protein [Mollicutes bacterium]|nr:cold-shock protein [Mollicutes bacterium]MDD7264419.1 cold-shock protein [bacterium]MDY4979111.1 cold-shock protein [Candidatus Onthovivens sp.]